MVGHGLLARRVVGQRGRQQFQLPGDEADERLQVHSRLRGDLGQGQSRVPDQRELYRKA